MRQFLRALLPYYRQVLGTIVVGSVAGLVMNTTVVLPAILLGRAIDAVAALSRHQAAANVVLARLQGGLRPVYGAVMSYALRGDTKECFARAQGEIFAKLLAAKRLRGTW